MEDVPKAKAVEDTRGLVQVVKHHETDEIIGAHMVGPRAADVIPEATLAVLVLGYPCVLGMATPLALIRGGGKAANRGILMRSGDAFQIFPDVDHVVLDKTGTITVGKPVVSEVVALKGDENKAIATAASAEAFSEHPLADAILGYADEHGIDYADPEGFDSVTGKGSGRP